MLPGITDYSPPLKKTRAETTASAITFEHNYSSEKKHRWRTLTETELTAITDNLLKKQQQQNLLRLLNQDPVTGKSRPVPIEERSTTEAPFYWQNHKLFQSGLKYHVEITLGSDQPIDIVSLPPEPTYWYSRNKEILKCLEKGADLSKVSLAGTPFTGKDIQETSALIAKHFAAFQDQLTHALEKQSGAKEKYKDQSQQFFDLFNKNYLPPLHKAIVRDDEEQIKNRIKQNPKYVELRDFLNMTPLLRAIDQNPVNLAIVRHLIKQDKASIITEAFTWTLSNERTLIKEHLYSLNPLSLSIDSALMSQNQAELDSWKKIIRLLLNHGSMDYRSGNGNLITLSSLIRENFLPLLEKHEKESPPGIKNDITLKFPELGNIPLDNFKSVMQVLIDHSGLCT